MARRRISEKRDMQLIQALVAQVSLMALGRPLLFTVDGLASYIKAVHRSFRSPLHTGKQRRPRLVAWPETVLV